MIDGFITRVWLYRMAGLPTWEAWLCSLLDILDNLMEIVYGKK